MRDPASGSAPTGPAQASEFAVKFQPFDQVRCRRRVEHRRRKEGACDPILRRMSRNPPGPGKLLDQDKLTGPSRNAGLTGDWRAGSAHLPNAVAAVLPGPACAPAKVGAGCNESTRTLLPTIAASLSAAATAAPGKTALWPAVSPVPPSWVRFGLALPRTLGGDPFSHRAEPFRGCSGVSQRRRAATPPIPVP